MLFFSCSVPLRSLASVGYSKLNNVFLGLEWNLQDRSRARRDQERQKEIWDFISIKAEPQENRQENMDLLAEAGKQTRSITNAAKVIQNAAKKCCEGKLFLARTYGYQEM